MADPFAEVDDLEIRWRPLTPTEEEVAAVLLSDASDMLRERWSDIDSRISNGAISASTPLRIVVGMVKRAMIAPDIEGLESLAQTAGPFSQTVKATNPNGNLYFSADDIRALDGFGRPRAKVGWLA